MAQNTHLKDCGLGWTAYMYLHGPFCFSKLDKFIRLLEKHMKLVVELATLPPDTYLWPTLYNESSRYILSLTGARQANALDEPPSEKCAVFASS